MAKVKPILGWCIPIVLIAVALMFPAIAQAGSIKIWPDQLKPVRPNSDIYQDGSMVTTGYFYAFFTLPIGSRITKVTYYYEGVGSTPATYLEFFRIKMGNRPELLGAEQSTGSTSGQVIPVDVPVTGDSVIRKGYRYYVRPYSSSFQSYFMGVKIDYLE